MSNLQLEQTNKFPLIWFGIAILIALLISGCGISDSDTDSGTESSTDNDSDDESETAVSFSLTSSAFQDGEEIPSKYTCEGRSTNPPLTISGIPVGTNKLVLFLDDLDGSPQGTIGKDPQVTTSWNHWVVFNIPVVSSFNASSLPSYATEGNNDSSDQEYEPPCPPGQPIRDKHEYQFTLYATDTEFDSGIANTRAGLVTAMEGFIIEKTTLTGTYGTN